MLRTHTCGQPRSADAESRARLAGWVASRRDHGGLIFIDIRDATGSCQVVFDPAASSKAHAAAERLSRESVVAVSGAFRARPAGQEKDANPTGGVELVADELTLFSAADTPPFPIDGPAPANEDLRLQFRFLDLRRPEMQEKMRFRSRLLSETRAAFVAEGCVEIETPSLIKDTPEGAREFLVPSRRQPGAGYALPQSPQQLKQLLQVAGFDRYFQIVRCFRDEDLRGDRQPEFTQLDFEMSFCEMEDILQMHERILTSLTKKLRPEARLAAEPWPRFSYREAMDRFGSDKPDIRFELELKEATAETADCGFRIFADAAAQKNGVVKMLASPPGCAISRKDIDDLTEAARAAGAGGLAFFRVSEGGFEGVPVEKLGRPLCEKLAEKAGAAAGQTLFFTAGPFQKAAESLGVVRSMLAKKAGVIPENTFAFCWVVDFPLFERTADGRLAACHHPFTRPKKGADLADPENALAESFDAVLNGYEIGGGSMRIFEAELQSKMFDLLGISPDEKEARFGHLLKAFSFGVPPHGGMAWGFDRLAMLLTDSPNIREVIAFPKTKSGADAMLGAPGSLSAESLAELGLRVSADKKD